METAKSSAKKSIKEAKKQVTQAQESLDKCAVTAPMDGIVTSISVQEGDTYSGGTILQIEDVSGYTISTSVDEYDISNVKVGQKVIVLTEATDEDELEGEVTFVAPSTESSSGQFFFPKWRKRWNDIHEQQFRRIRSADCIENGR